LFSDYVADKRPEFKLALSTGPELQNKLLLAVLIGNIIPTSPFSRDSTIMVVA
jgi:hypothetical protein